AAGGTMIPSMLPRVTRRGKRIQSSSLVSAALSVLFVSASEASALADENEICAKAAEQLQDLRGARELVQAREKALACQRESCPPVVRSDCERWLAEIDAAIPSIVYRAEDPNGKDRLDVEVWVDGKRALSHLDGSDMPINPGHHQVVFRARGLAE